ncbi:hypothetical protein ABZT47_06230 [Sphaerisporangium sp. NPDC005289]|uniref:hypothetical protein n=1 Tax=Sphaerisporangium sp. NPDC005289 TaxID=3155247 RepID=UPI0033B52AA6
MMNVSLLTMLRSGRFGPVELGASRKFIRDVFGEPDDYAVMSKRRPHFQDIWVFGDIEFHFDQSTDQVWLIYTDTFEIPAGSGAFSLDPWVLRWNRPLEDVCAALDDADVGWEFDPNPPPDVVGVLTSGGVQLGFLRNEGLQAISLCQRP